MATPDDEKLEFSLELNVTPWLKSTADAQKGMKTFEKEAAKSVDAVEKEVKSLGDALTTALDPKKATTATTRGMDQLTKSIAGARKEAEKLAKIHLVGFENLGVKSGTGVGEGGVKTGANFAAMKLKAMRSTSASSPTNATGTASQSVGDLLTTGMGPLMGTVATGAAGAALAVAAIGAAAAAATAEIVSLSTSLGSWMSGLASDFEQLQGQFDSVFGAAAAGGTAFVNQFSAEINRSRSEVTKVMADFGLLFSNMEFPEAAAENFSEALTGVAFNIAALSNQDVDAVAGKLERALRGGSGAAKQLGINMTQAAVQQELYAQGINKTVAEANEQELAFARMNIIMRETAKTQGEAASQIETFEGMMIALSAAAENLGEEFGKELNDAILEVIQSFGGLEAAKEVMRAVLGVAKEVSIAVVQAAGEVATWVKGWIEGMGGAVAVQWKAVAVINEIRKAYYTVELATKLVAGAIYTVYRSTIYPVFTTMKNMVFDVADAITVTLGGALSTFASGVSTLMHAAAAVTPGTWGDAMESTAQEVDSWIGVMDGYTAGWNERAVARAQETLEAWTGIASDISAAWSGLDLASSTKGAAEAGVAAKFAWDQATQSALNFRAAATGQPMSPYSPPALVNPFAGGSSGGGPGAAGGSGGGSGGGGGGGGLGASGGAYDGYADYSSRYRTADGRYNGGRNYSGGFGFSQGEMSSYDGPRGFAMGGLVQGPSGRDNVPAMLTAGERVMSTDAVEKFGPELEAMAQGKSPGRTIIMNVVNQFPGVTQMSDSVMERAMAPQYARLRRLGVQV